MTHNGRATPLNSYRLALFSVGKLSSDSRFLTHTEKCPTRQVCIQPFPSDNTIVPILMAVFDSFSERFPASKILLLLKIRDASARPCRRGASRVRLLAAHPPRPHREGEEPWPMMHECGKSAPAIVAGKPANEVGQSTEEPVEQSFGTKRNADQQTTRRAQNRESVPTALDRIRRVARKRSRGRRRSTSRQRLRLQRPRALDLAGLTLRLFPLFSLGNCWRSSRGAA